MLPNAPDASRVALSPNRIVSLPDSRMEINNVELRSADNKKPCHFSNAHSGDIKMWGGRRLYMHVTIDFLPALWIITRRVANVEAGNVSQEESFFCKNFINRQ